MFSCLTNQNHDTIKTIFWLIWLKVDSLFNFLFAAINTVKVVRVAPTTQSPPSSAHGALWELARRSAEVKTPVLCLGPGGGGLNVSVALSGRDLRDLAGEEGEKRV